MSVVTVRPARPADCRAVAAMVVELAALFGVASGTTAEGLANEAFGPRPTIEILVAASGDTLVGYLLHQDCYSTYRGANGLFVVDLFVAPDRRGQGIGEALIGAAARRGLGRRVARLHQRPRRPLASRGAPCAGLTSPTGVPGTKEMLAHFRAVGRWRNASDRPRVGFVSPKRRNSFTKPEARAHVAHRSALGRYASAGSATKEAAIRGGGARASA